MTSPSPPPSPSASTALHRKARQLQSNHRIGLIGLDRASFQSALEGLGEPAFRAK
ncbi:uncharacterized protein METZ01_LOCUS449090, partial [marine metagenome]